MFSTAQAAKALCITPATMRKHRQHKGLGTETSPGRVSWKISELEEIRRGQGSHMAHTMYRVKFLVHQLNSQAIQGNMNIWAPGRTVAESKAESWFWEALLKDQPQKWGIPTRFQILALEE